MLVQIIMVIKPHERTKINIRSVRYFSMTQSDQIAMSYFRIDGITREASYASMIGNEVANQHTAEESEKKIDCDFQGYSFHFS